MTATLPLQSCRMFPSCLLLSCHSFGTCGKPVDFDCSRLRTAIEADAASCAVVAGVARRMHAIVAQFSRKFETLGRARLDAEPASFALFNIDDHVAARRTRHIRLPLFYLVTAAPASLVCVSTSSFSRRTPKVPHGSRDAQSQSTLSRVRESTCHADKRRHIR